VLQGVTSEHSALGSAMKRGFSTALDYSLRPAIVAGKAGNHDWLSFHTYKKFSSLAVATLRSLL